MDIKILLLGNGFEANFNKNMVNFNETFKNWIINLSIEDIQELIEKISLDVFNDFGMLENKKNFIIEIIEELKEEYKSENEILLLEDILFKIGSKIERDNFFEEDSELKKDIFLSIKYLIGYFIESNTINECENFKNDFNNLSRKIDKPNFLITTNYTKSAIYLAEKMKQGIYKKNIQTIYLHGKFGEGISKYDDIEINLINKNVKKYFKEIESQLNKRINEIYEITFDIFGHNLAKDNHIILSILDLFLEANKTGKINFIYYSEEDKSLLMEAFKKIEKNYWMYTFNLDHFIINNLEDNYKIEVNFIEYSEYELWIWLNGQREF